MPSSFQSERVPAVIKGHQHFSYGGAVLPEEWMIKAIIQKEHPFQSHIQRYAMFPSYESPDDPHTGVRAASTLPLNPLLPSSAPAVTVLHKTKGSPYRHEILDVPMATKREATVYPGHFGFQNPLKGDAQVLYPKPVKTVYPNASLRNWNTPLSERNVHMLRNLEKAQWLTTYQLNYTGTGPSNPIKLDDFHEKTIAVITGEINPLTTQLRERSFPTFIPSRPLEGRKARVLQNLHPLKSTSAPVPSPPATSDLDLALPVTAQKCAQWKNHVSHSLDSDAYKTDQVTESNQSFEDNRSVPGFGRMPGRTEMSDLSYRETPSTDCRSFDENIQTMKSQLEKRNKHLSKGLQPRSCNTLKTDLRPRSTLLQLQDSFRKSEAHQRFHQSIKDTEVDLRDNHDTGRKHTFCGFNSYYFHN
ncbi:hypothetical protein E1301_Tti010862 [Triplophysa tibetana]|uniref:Uncharacterized protein n=1 Tax=Triplophysa tibetana TaxID=1572043 RepID=A0A5A9N060_9TELE|nr:hypothetical protein E1301_Tti010862 [Triplophysa tibetana]